MAKIDPDCRRTQDKLVELALCSAETVPPDGVAGHLERCKQCRLFAQGIQAAPLLFHGDSLYTPALKHRALVAAAGASRTGGVMLALVLSMPAAVFVLLSFVVQVYLVYLALPKSFGTDPVLWMFSIAVVTAVGAAGGFICLAVLVRNHARGTLPQEVFGD